MVSGILLGVSLLLLRLFADQPFSTPDCNCTYKTNVRVLCKEEGMTGKKLGFALSYVTSAQPNFVEFGFVCVAGFEVCLTL